MEEQHFEISFLVRDQDKKFQKSIDFLETEGETKYLRQSDNQLKLYGSLNGGFFHADAPVAAKLRELETLIFYPPCYNYTSSEDGREQLETALGFVSRLYQAVDPSYVFGLHNWQIDVTEAGHPKHEISPPVSDEGLANDRIDHPTWLMLFPPEMVTEYGREWLLELPAAYVEELDDGAIMVVATTDFRDCETGMDVVELIDDAMEPIVDGFDEREP